MHLYLTLSLMGKRSFRHPAVATVSSKVHPHSILQVVAADEWFVWQLKIRSNGCTCCTRWLATLLPQVSFLLEDL